MCVEMKLNVSHLITYYSLFKNLFCLNFLFRKLFTEFYE